MEALLKLSGLLGDEDDDRTDLGTLERRLADKNNSQSNHGTPTKDSAGSSKSGSQPRTFQSPNNTPHLEMMSTPAHSPLEQPKEKEEAVEELSDMMCSLVTNNCGETRYIGICIQWKLVDLSLISYRFFVRLLHIFSERYPVGQRKDWRYLVPRNDCFSRYA